MPDFVGDCVCPNEAAVQGKEVLSNEQPNVIHYFPLTLYERHSFCIKRTKIMHEREINFVG